MQDESSTPASKPAPRVLPSKSPWFAQVPCVKLGGFDWPIPKLAPRQNRFIEPRLMPLMLKVLPAYQVALNLFARNELPPEGFNVLTEEQYDTALDVIAMALTRAHPDFQKNDLLDLEGVGLPQVLAALTVVWQQTGIYVEKPKDDKGASKPGELQSASTGTESSPAPAGSSEELPSTGKTP